MSSVEMRLYGPTRTGRYYVAPMRWNAKTSRMETCGPQHDVTTDVLEVTMVTHPRPIPRPERARTLEWALGVVDREGHEMVKCGEWDELTDAATVLATLVRMIRAEVNDPEHVPLTAGPLLG